MSKHTRRDFLRAGLGAAASLGPAGALLSRSPAPARALLLDAAASPHPPRAGWLRLGTARSPGGSTLTADSRSLRLDGQPWLPVMGEFHYARYPEAQWRRELLKMKAGGVTLVSTYVFWIHHEEVEGRWDWAGRRSLAGFVRACRDVDLPLVVRCGPWCHGEVRNGGFPDWLQAKGLKLRSTSPAFLDRVRPLYAQIAAQTRGLLWKDGGPIVGIQCDNEYRGPAEYLLALKGLAREAGLDVPLYTRTGWPALSTSMPEGEFLPLFGAYPDGFWDRELTPMPGKYGDGFRFLLARGASSAAIGTDQLGTRRPPEGDDVGAYPYFCCEIGGGMETSYHRRILIAPGDIEAIGLVKIGSGNNLQGYYMYHGGINPDGRLSDLEETQATGGYNDLPVKTYDFQAPLGQYGQVREHYHRLRRLHLFLANWGPLLATMPAHVPAVTPDTVRDTAALRWSVRTDGSSGFVFVNNYQRLQPMPARPGTQFTLQLTGGPLTFPTEPVTVPADSAFLWPFNMDLAGARLVHATAQPICRVTDGSNDYFIFGQTPGVPTEFVIDAAGVTVGSANGAVAAGGGRVRISQVRPGTGAAVRLHTAGGRTVNVILLDAAQSLACWKGEWRGRERVFLTHAGLTIDGGTLGLASADSTALTVCPLPAPASLIHGGATVHGTPDGLFRRFAAPAFTVAPVRATWEAVQPAGQARTVPIGPKGVAEQPSDADFAQAAVWRVHLPADIAPDRDLLLRVHYVGDVARFYLDGKLIDDNFYNGNPFELGLKTFAPDIYQQELLLKILPLRRDAPVYLAEGANPDFGGADTALTLAGVEVVETHEAAFT